MQVLIKEIVGYEVSYLKSFFFWILCIASAGVLILLSFWYPWIYTAMTKRRTTLKKGSHLLLKGIDDTWEELQIQNIRIKEFKDIFNDSSNPFTQFNKYVSSVFRRRSNADHNTRVVGLEYLSIAIYDIYMIIQLMFSSSHSMDFF